VKSIRRIKVKLQETIKPNISYKTKNILGVDRVEQFMHRRNVEVLSRYSGYTRRVGLRKVNIVNCSVCSDDDDDDDDDAVV